MSTAEEIAEVPIDKLRDACKDVAEALDELRNRMAAVINEMAEDLAEIVGATTHFEDYVPEQRLEGAVNALLAEVALPAGTRRPTLPDTPGARRALMALYDAMGREKPTS